ncbi:hypothetical protein C7U92_29625 [Bradyrhizobium sp. WBOS7]|uniref:Uncharacterized protein n=1 Tax=Bradyrhizobium betae TaxID=244734 RepID=A0AAE9NAJ9_9BRAD|nr:hypothetical protein [Bradyrhizobium sp. WBOS2]MDD1574743.1 hypothetical protein [Bradyrhizobium sp. WBOS1]MDD1580849.1 hypothetical protein [Bradyrhizobium sp. WBOS7]MDD1604352.1 hypothetical protein [Bradyrhizobium sp. WBOS16]UUO35380.1 hypothetical protein DCK84_12925 [Bradyrhizobium sp. WBOS01]UUO41689.1 hypothetical protein DCM75_13680 [Bradyrhizobium sp. WBOS02]UUO56026.1 hypothetical protein DCM79_25470 [Bradyrhizobium sp. WBOS07]UUO66018.1 hypothetical protein DCM83_12935 [Bradyrh
MVPGICFCGKANIGATPSVSSLRTQGPITPGRSLARTSGSVLLPPLADRFRGMGPCVRRDDGGGHGGTAFPD